MIKGFTSDTANKIKKWRDTTFENIILRDCRNNNNNNNSKKNKNSYNLSMLEEQKEEELLTAFDQIIHNTLYPKIFSQLLDQFKREEKIFKYKLKKLRNLTQNQIGIKSIFQCNMNKACHKLKEINKLQTPIHKLGCLKYTSKIIRECVELKRQQIKNEESKNDNNNNNNLQKTNSEDMALTTDDVLSFFVYCMIHSKLNNILATVEYLKYFHFQTGLTSKLDYFSATFQGCVQYINEDLAPKYGISKNKNNNSNSNPNLNLNLNSNSNSNSNEYQNGFNHKKHKKYRSKANRSRSEAYIKHLFEDDNDNENTDERSSDHSKNKNKNKNGSKINSNPNLRIDRAKTVNFVSQNNNNNNNANSPLNKDMSGTFKSVKEDPLRFDISINDDLNELTEIASHFSLDSNNGYDRMSGQW